MKRFNMTMMNRLLAFSLLVIMGVTGAMAYDLTALPEASTATNRKYYLIYDPASKFYVHFRGESSNIRIEQCSQINDTWLWYVMPDGDGYKIGNKATSQYLQAHAASTTTGSLDRYSATGDKWYIRPGTSGCIISTDATGNYHQWQSNKVSLQEYGHIQFGPLTRGTEFVFVPLESVLEKAQTGVYLLKNRSTGMYMSQAAGNNDVTPSSKITTNCVWNVEQSVNPDSLGIVRIYSNMHDAVPPLRIKGTWSLSVLPAHDLNDSYFEIGGNEQHTLFGSIYTSGNNAGCFQRETSSWNTLADINDWELIPYSEVETDEILYTEEDIKAGRYFRIQNYMMKYDKTGRVALGEAEKGGWLEDIDHRADSSMLDLPGNRVDFYCAVPDSCAASAIWEFELAIAKSNTSDDQATGVLGKHDHNIYRLRNVNTNKYVGEVNVVRNGSDYVPVVRNVKGEKGPYSAGLWLESLGDGQYCIVVYDRSSTGNDVAKGYLVADNTTGSTNRGAGLKFIPAGTNNANRPAANSNGAWCLYLADKINVAMNYCDGATWASAYFPFDVAPGTGATLHTGEWNHDSTGVVLHETANVPAGVGMIVTGGPRVDHLTLAITEPIASASAYADSPLRGIVESESYPIDEIRKFASAPVEFKDNPNAANADSTITKYGWGYYYVLSGLDGDHNDNVGMYHPGDNQYYLLANKAYIKVSDAGSARPRFLFVKEAPDETTVTAVEEVQVDRPVGDPVFFDLMGRSVVNPTRGIYIVNGKKVLIQ